MPKRKAEPVNRMRHAFAILAMALAVFLCAEAFLLLRSDSGRLTLARTLGWGDRAQLTRIVGKQIRVALDGLAVPSDSVRVSVQGQGPAPLHWRVGLRPEASLIQANHAVAQRLASAGGAVLSGYERALDDGETQVTLLVGVGSRPTHEIELVRSSQWTTQAPRRPRVALVLFGFENDAERASEFFRIPAPLAAALVPGSLESRALFKAARAAGREVVLHLPLEPVNYPQVNPGSGTVLVTMKPARITGLVRRYLDQADPVVAVSNHMGSLATQDKAVMRAVYAELRRRRLPFVHIRPTAGAVCRALAAEEGVLYEEPDAIIDQEARRDRALEKRWNELVEHARDRGELTIWLRATPLVASWLARMVSRGAGDVEWVPLSELLRRPGQI